MKKHDLLTSIPISAAKAVLGSQHSLSTLDGSVALTIPPGSQGGQKLRLKGKGLYKNKNERGNIIATIKIAIPKNPSNEEKELYQRLLKLNTSN